MIEILLPVGALSGEPPRLAGMFIDALTAKPDTQVLEISGNAVLSGNMKLREVMTMIVKAGRYTELMSELQKAMFPSELGIGEFACLKDGMEHRYAVFETTSPPNLKWRIEAVAS